VRELCAEMDAYCRHGFRAVKMKVGRNSDIEGSPLRAMATAACAKSRWRRTWPGCGPCGRPSDRRALDGGRERRLGRSDGGQDGAGDGAARRLLVRGAGLSGRLRGSAEVARKLAMRSRATRRARTGGSASGITSRQGDPLRAARRGLGGGLTESLKIAHLAQAWNLPLAPHIHGSAVAVAAAAHLLGALPNASMARWCSRPSPDGELSRSARRGSDGTHRAQRPPGLGLELDPVSSRSTGRRLAGSLV